MTYSQKDKQQEETQKRRQGSHLSCKTHRQKIVANAVLGSNITKNGDELSIGLSNVNLWKNQILLKPLVESLEFIKNKSKWVVFMQGGVVKITDNDFKTLSDKN